MIDTIKFIWNHPLCRSRRAAALARFLRWQVASRLALGPIAVPFVDGAQMLVSPGMTGATGNIYCGLHEFQEMAFVLHLLRVDDLFADIGANVGSYTLLAASRGARVIAFEPGRAARIRLEQNVGLNRLAATVEVLAEAAGAHDGEGSFAIGLDTVNRFLRDGEAISSRVVRVITLDSALAGRVPTLVKIDVEGFESEVLKGATCTLANPRLMALIVEIWETAQHGAATFLGEAGFEPLAYDPFSRSLLPVSGSSTGNVVFVRNRRIVEERLRAAARVSVLGINF